MAIVGPTNLSKLIASIPGHVTKLPFPITAFKVEMTGLNAHPCKYLAKSDFDCVLFTIIFNAWRAYVCCGDGGDCRGMSHNPTILLQ